MKISEKLKAYDLLLKVINADMPDRSQDTIVILEMEAIARDAEDFGSHVFYLDVSRCNWVKIATAFGYAIENRRDRALPTVSPKEFEIGKQVILQEFKQDIEQAQTRMRDAYERRHRKMVELCVMGEQWHKEHSDANSSNIVRDV